jgi:hypothetical protein
MLKKGGFEMLKKLIFLNFKKAEYVALEFWELRSLTTSKSNHSQFLNLENIAFFEELQGASFDTY